MSEDASTGLPTAPQAVSIPAVDDGAVVWHRRDLRIDDNPALAMAAADYKVLAAVFVFDPQFYDERGLACDARIEFLHESLADLDRQYREIGGRLCLAHGPPVEILSRFRERGWDVVAAAEPSGRYGHRRDRAAAHVADVRFVDDDGLVRDKRDTRTGWSDHVEAWFTADTYDVPSDVAFAMADDAMSAAVADVDTAITIEAIEAAYDIDSDKQRVPRGGREAGLRRLRHFTRSLSAYPGSISAPHDAETGTSRLSAPLRFGCLSIGEVFQYVAANAPDGRAKSMFRSRLYWNRHYSQKLEDWPGWMDRAVNPVMTDFYADSVDSEKLAAWRAGETGYPMVDASMRCLRATGWLNFRMRAMCASFLCDLLAQPWKPGADWFYYHLIDADPAINYTQFQIQAGVVGTSMLRIYNPRKQVGDHDADGTFIFEWVPELRGLPPGFLDRPERTPLSVQADSGVDIGADYPYPIVEYEVARERAVSRLTAVREDAHRALSDPEIARRASFSRRGRSSESGRRETADTETDERDNIDNIDNTDEQSSLSEFG